MVMLPDRLGSRVHDPARECSFILAKFCVRSCYLFNIFFHGWARGADFCYMLDARVPMQRHIPNWDTVKPVYVTSTLI